MSNESIVVMENGSRWPTWVDRQAGSESNVAVFCQAPLEPIAGFGNRLSSCLASCSAVAAPARAVLVCSPESSSAHTSVRETVLWALISAVASSGGGQVVLVADGDSALRLELAALATRLNDLLDQQDAPVTLMFRVAPRLLTQALPAPSRLEQRRVA